MILAAPASSNAPLTIAPFVDCQFTASFWKKTQLQASKAAGNNFNQATFKETQLDNASFRYANCVGSRWEHCLLSNCDFREAFLSEVKFTAVQLDQVDFTGADFFKTMLKNIDLSACTIEGILVSDSFAELRGCRMNLFQAAEIARLLGISIV